MKCKCLHRGVIGCVGECDAEECECVGEQKVEIGE
jgi:hypothetical protein